MFNKRGQGLSVNAIIMIVLGVVVLAVLALGFTMGWGNIKDRIAPSNNVKTVVDACSLACNTNSQFDYCTYPREIKIGGDALEVMKDKDGKVLVIKDKKYSCKDLLNYPNFGITECASVTCPAETENPAEILDNTGSS